MDEKSPEIGEIN